MLTSSILLYLNKNIVLNIMQQMAVHCVKHFHKSYAGTSKLHVDHAFAKKDFDPNSYRPWSKYSEGSSRNAALNKKDDSNIEIEQQKVTKRDSEKTKLVDKKKEEFLAAMGVGNSKSSFWSNDDGLMKDEDLDQQKDNVNEGNDEEKGLDSSDDDSDSDDNSETSMDENDNNTKQSESKGNANTVDDDMAFLRSKATTKENLLSDSEDDGDDSSSVPSSSDSEESSDSDSDDESDSDEEPSTKDEKVRTQTKEPPKQNIPNKTRNENRPNISNDPPSSFSPTRLFIRNLSFQTTESELKELFSKFGAVIECHIPIDDHKKRKGYAFIRFSSKESANKAKEELDKTDFQGRLIHVLPAKKAPHEIKEDEEKAKQDIEDGPSNPKHSQTYKSQKEEERQRNAPNDTTGWNASILRTDAVVDNLSSRLDIAKSDILVSNSKTAGSAAVRLALGETHVLQENKEYFAKHGFDMEGLITANDGNAKRSLTQILVKNLPYNGNQEEQLHKLFADHRLQSPHRMLIPPSKTVVLLEYEHPTEARAVFRKLAYKRFQHVPLYLEWAPLATMPVSEDNQTKEESEDKISKPSINDEDEDIDTSSSATNQSIFVKNLNFATTESQLLDHFTSAGISARAAKIPTKLTTSSKRLSMGYGFVECTSVEEAQNALRKLKGTMLDGHSLQLLLSSKQISTSNDDMTKSTKKRKKLPTKIAVKNIPFQASKSEITALFGTFGQIKNFRLPKKFGSAQHRGFGFVEFVTGEEAANAVDNLGRTHLYGRKLVLEWAEVEENEKEAINQNTDISQKPKKIRFSD